MTNKSAILYLRISSKGQEKGESLDMQEKFCLEYCKRNNYDVAGVFKDTYTGTKINRPELDKMMDFIDNSYKKIDYCVILKIDRGSRTEEVYEELKKILKSKKVLLKDSYGIIQEDIKVVPNINGFDTSIYDWAKMNPGRYAEKMTSMIAEDERNNILIRTIPAEIANVANGYHARQPNYGYKNKKVQTTDGKRKTIQVKHPAEGPFIEYIYNKRNEGMSDKDIVKNVNLNGYISRRGKQMTVKYMQTLIIKPIYCGIIKEKWTDDKPIKASYEGLVSIEIWNKANQGKIKIIKNKKGVYDILFVSKNNDGNKIDEKRDYSTDDKNEYKFRRLVAPPCIRESNFRGSASKGKNKYYKNYHFSYNNEQVKKFGLKQKSLGISKDKFEKTIYDYFKYVKIDHDFLIIFGKVMKEIWENKKMEYVEIEKNKKKTIRKLENKEQQIIDIMNELYLSSLKNKEVLINANDNKLTDIQNDILKYKSSKKDIKNETFDDFKKKAFYVMEHLNEILLNSHKESELKVIFDLVFIEKPTFDEIENGTPKIYPVFQYLSQQKNSQNESLDENLKWQAH